MTSLKDQAIPILQAAFYGLVYAGSSVALFWPLAFLFSVLSLGLFAAALRHLLGGWSMGLAVATWVVGHRVRALEAFEGCASVPTMDLMRCPSEEVFPVQEVLVRRVRILRERGLCPF